jgi:hypothetical protein
VDGATSSRRASLLGQYAGSEEEIVAKIKQMQAEADAAIGGDTLEDAGAGAGGVTTGTTQSAAAPSSPAILATSATETSSSSTDTTASGEEAAMEVDGGGTLPSTGGVAAAGGTSVPPPRQAILPEREGRSPRGGRLHRHLRPSRG